MFRDVPCSGFYRRPRRVRAICLLGVPVAVEGEKWIVLDIDKYDHGIF